MVRGGVCKWPPLAKRRWWGPARQTWDSWISGQVSTMGVSCCRNGPGGLAAISIRPCPTPLPISQLEWYCKHFLNTHKTELIHCNFTTWPRSLRASALGGPSRRRARAGGHAGAENLRDKESKAVSSRRQSKESKAVDNLRRQSTSTRQLPIRTGIASPVTPQVRC